MNIKSWQITFLTTIKNNLFSRLKFHKSKFKNTDRNYNLQLEGFAFSPKFNQKVPIIRLQHSGEYVIEPANSILSDCSYKCHLHPDDLLKINALAIEQSKGLTAKIISRDISGDITLSNGESLNIYKPCFESSDVNALFTLSKCDIISLLEERGLYQGRIIAQQIDKLKKDDISRRRNNIKSIHISDRA